MKYRCIAPWKIYQIGQILEAWEFRRIPIDKQGRFKLIVEVSPVEKTVDTDMVGSMIANLISHKELENKNVEKVVKTKKHS